MVFSPNETFSYGVCFVDPGGLHPREQVFCKLLCFKMFCLAFHLVFHGGHFSYLSKSHDMCVLADGSLSWSSETVFQLCRPIVALLFLVLGCGQPGWVAQALLGLYVCRRMSQTRDRVPCRCGVSQPATTGLHVGSSQLLMWESGGRKKLFLTLSISCTMKITVICIYTLGKFYCCLIYGIILLIPGLFNKTLYLLRSLILVCVFRSRFVCFRLVQESGIFFIFKNSVFFKMQI